MLLETYSVFLHHTRDERSQLQATGFISCVTGGNVVWHFVNMSFCVNMYCSVQCGVCVWVCVAEVNIHTL